MVAGPDGREAAQQRRGGHRGPRRAGHGQRREGLALELVHRVALQGPAQAVVCGGGVGGAEPAGVDGLEVGVVGPGGLGNGEGEGTEERVRGGRGRALDSEGDALGGEDGADGEQAAAELGDAAVAVVDGLGALDGHVDGAVEEGPEHVGLGVGRELGDAGARDEGGEDVGGGGEGGAEAVGGEVGGGGDGDVGGGDELEVGEVGGDDGVEHGGEGDAGEHPRDGEEAAGEGARGDVAEADCAHEDEGVPHAVLGALEVVAADLGVAGVVASK